MTNTTISWQNSRAVRFLVQSAMFALVFTIVLATVLAGAAPSPSEPARRVFVPTSSPATHVTVEAPASLAEMEARMAASAAVVPETGSVITRATSHERHSAVLDAPSAFDGAWAAEGRERRVIRSRWNRFYSEHRLITLFGGNHAAELYRVTRLVLSRLIVSEANFIHDDRLDRLAPNGNHAERDAPAIYAVLRHNRRVGQTLLGSIREHAHYVTEERVPTARMDRMRWIAELQDNDERPQHFPETDSNGEPLNWDRDYAPRWRVVRQFADELLHGEHLGVCADAPVRSWGGRCEDVQGACDDDSSRGFIRYNCDPPDGPTANGFWCNPHTPGCVQDPTVTPEEVVDPDHAR